MARQVVEHLENQITLPGDALIIKGSSAIVSYMGMRVRTDSWLVTPESSAKVWRVALELEP